MLTPYTLLRSQTEGAARAVPPVPTSAVAMIVPDLLSPFFAELARGLEETVSAAGSALLLCSTAGHGGRESGMLELLANLGMKAVAVVPSGASQPSLRALAERGIATVVVDRDIPGATADCVFCDNETGAYQAVLHLIGLNHRRIGFVAGPAQSYPADTRLAGYQEALRSAQIPLDPALVVVGDFGHSSGAQGARRLLESAQPPTAIFACNDMMALGVMAEARRMGLTLPQDLSVVGFDDIHMAGLAEPQLTTVEQPKVDLGRQAGTMLLERIATPALPYRRTMLPTRLFVRSSTAPLGLDS